jgi:hypothetical protein
MPSAIPEVVPSLVDRAALPNRMPSTQLIHGGAGGEMPYVKTPPSARVRDTLVGAEEVSTTVLSMTPPLSPLDEIMRLSAPWGAPPWMGLNEVCGQGNGFVSDFPPPPAALVQAMQKSVVPHAAQTLGAPILPVPKPRTAPTEPVTLPPLAAALPPCAKATVMSPAVAAAQAGVEVTHSVAPYIPMIAAIVPSVLGAHGASPW